MTTDELTPRGRAAVAAICFATGAGIAALAAGIIPADAAKFHAPHWVVGACGSVFMLAACLILIPATLPRLQNFLGAVLLSLFAAIPGWIAFGPGPRVFGGSLSFGVVTSATHPGESTGRVVFGVAAVVVGLFAAYAWVRWLRLVCGSRDDRRDATQ
jgi:hypothetical protein